MSKKYSVDFKFKVVQEYLQGGLSTKLLARKYDISSKSLVTKWINQYQQFGEAGLRHQRTKQQYSLNFKLDLLRFNQDTGASYKENWGSVFLCPKIHILSKICFFLKPKIL